MALQDKKSNIFGIEYQGKDNCNVLKNIKECEKQQSEPQQQLSIEKSSTPKHNHRNSIQNKSIAQLQASSLKRYSLLQTNKQVDLFGQINNSKLADDKHTTNNGKSEELQATKNILQFARRNSVLESRYLKQFPSNLIALKEENIPARAVISKEEELVAANCSQPHVVSVTLNGESSKHQKNVTNLQSKKNQTQENNSLKSGEENKQQQEHDTNIQKDTKAFEFDEQQFEEELMIGYTEKFLKLEKSLKEIDSTQRFEKALQHFRDAMLIRQPIDDSDVNCLHFLNFVNELNSAWLWSFILKIFSILFVFQVFFEPVNQYDTMYNQQPQILKWLLVQEVFVLLFFLADCAFTTILKHAQINLKTAVPEQTENGNAFTQRLYIFLLNYWYPLLKCVAWILILGDFATYYSLRPSSYLRFATIVRPIFIIFQFKELRHTVAAIAMSARHILDIFIFFIILSVFWGFIGYNLFIDHEKIVNPDQDIYFDSFQNSVVSMYTLLSLDSYPNICINIVLDTEWYLIFFVLYIAYYKEQRAKLMIKEQVLVRESLVMCFLCLRDQSEGSFLGVSYENFYDLIDQYYNGRAIPGRVSQFFNMLNLQGNGNLDLEEFLDVRELLNQTRRVYEISNKCWDGVREFCNRYLFFAKIGESSLWNGFILTVVAANTVVIIAYAVVTDDTVLSDLDNVDTFFNIVYIVDFVIKFVGEGVEGYFEDQWHQFDFVMVVITIVTWIGMEYIYFLKTVKPGKLLKITRLERAIRIFRSIRSIKIMTVINYGAQTVYRLKKLIQKVAVCFPMISRVFFNFLLVMYVYAIIGALIFNTQTDQSYRTDSPWDDQIQLFNFDSVVSSLLVLLQVITQSGWVNIMFDYGYKFVSLLHGLIWDVFSVVEQSFKEQEAYSKQLLHDQCNASYGSSEQQNNEDEDSDDSEEEDQESQKSQNIQSKISEEASQNEKDSENEEDEDGSQQISSQEASKSKAIESVSGNSAQCSNDNSDFIKEKKNFSSSDRELHFKRVQEKENSQNIVQQLNNITKKKHTQSHRLLRNYHSNRNLPNTIQNKQQNVQKQSPENHNRKIKMNLSGTDNRSINRENIQKLNNQLANDQNSLQQRKSSNRLSPNIHTEAASRRQIQANKNLSPPLNLYNQRQASKAKKLSPSISKAIYRHISPNDQGSPVIMDSCNILQKLTQKGQQLKNSSPRNMQDNKKYPLSNFPIDQTKKSGQINQQRKKSFDSFSSDHVIEETYEYDIINNKIKKLSVIEMNSNNLEKLNQVQVSSPVMAQQQLSCSQESKGRQECSIQVDQITINITPTNKIDVLEQNKQEESLASQKSAIASIKESNSPKIVEKQVDQKNMPLANLKQGAQHAYYKSNFTITTNALRLATLRHAYNGHDLIAQLMNEGDGTISNNLGSARGPEDSLEHQQLKTALQHIKDLEWHSDDSSSEEDGEKKLLDEYEKRKQRKQIIISRVQNTDTLAYRTYVEKDHKNQSFNPFTQQDNILKFRPSMNSFVEKGANQTQTLNFQNSQLLMLKRALRHSGIENQKFLRCLHKFEKQVQRRLMCNGAVLKLLFQVAGKWYYLHRQQQQEEEGRTSGYYFEVAGEGPWNCTKDVFTQEMELYMGKDLFKKVDMEVKKSDGGSMEHLEKSQRIDSSQNINIGALFEAEVAKMSSGTSKFSKVSIQVQQQNAFFFFVQQNQAQLRRSVERFLQRNHQNHAEEDQDNPSEALCARMVQKISLFAVTTVNTKEIINDSRSSIFRHLESVSRSPTTLSKCVEENDSQHSDSGYLNVEETQSQQSQQQNKNLNSISSTKQKQKSKNLKNKQIIQRSQTSGQPVFQSTQVNNKIAQKNQNEEINQFNQLLIQSQQESSIKNLSASQNQSISIMTPSSRHQARSRSSAQSEYNNIDSISSSSPHNNVLYKEFQGISPLTMSCLVEFMKDIREALYIYKENLFLKLTECFEQQQSGQLNQKKSEKNLQDIRAIRSVTQSKTPKSQNNQMMIHQSNQTDNLQKKINSKRLQV